MKRMVRVAGLLAIACALWAFSGEEKLENLKVGTLRVGGLHVDDKEGKPIAFLGVEEGGAVLRLYGRGSDGMVVISGGVANEEHVVDRRTGIEISGGMGAPRVLANVGVGRGAPAMVEVRDPFQEESGVNSARVSMGLMEHRPLVSLYKDGKEVGSLP